MFYDADYALFGADYAQLSSLVNAILLIILCAQAVWVIVWTLRRAERVNYFSALLAISLSGFALPQLFGLLQTSEALPPGALAKTLVMTNLCFACAVTGFSLRVRPLHVLQWTYTPSSLLFIGAFLTLLGAGFYFKITRLPAEMRDISEWSGIITIYNFFTFALPCGLAVALYLVLKHPTPAAKILVAIGTLLILDRAIMSGRRSQAVVLILTLVLSLWLFKRKTIPRLLFLSFAIIGCLVVYSIADYRKAVLGEGKGFNSIFMGGGFGGFENVAKISFMGNLQQVTKKGDAEYEAALFGIAETDQKMAFDFGMSQWDGLVQMVVPAQFLGRDFKESLKFNLNKSGGHAFTYEKGGAIAEPEILDAFRSFWYFGCLKFLLIGLLMRLLYTTALAGNLNCAFLYIILMPSALLVISYPIDYFIDSFVHSVLLMAGAILLVRTFRPSAIIRQRSVAMPSRCADEPTKSLTTIRFAKSWPWQPPKRASQLISPLPRFVAVKRMNWAIVSMKRCGSKS